MVLLPRSDIQCLLGGAVRLRGPHNSPRGAMLTVGLGLVADCWRDILRPSPRGPTPTLIRGFVIDC